MLLLVLGQQTGYEMFLFVFSGSDGRRRSSLHFLLAGEQRKGKTDTDQKITHLPPKTQSSVSMLSVV